ncbi:glycerophosphodiester phosphodiesterase 1 [Odontomachus brunneus]|uniref:glycerophosphodiester phosphodiesterase 1 n=1 Tax=Odontomachus brunneus TaxID=486640 RepID=UPI0013F2A63E|nr:glycerophosphodiester phosphodiesterase 1 [Odontomachus brunneus]XP_032666355.1 glycerophosphodiester phosphodiesterase 1 [Odontomachus brunneus]XP_032666356.1 glycerophosphodiester phosphodiesterase 1 [Odontomachus brunneus]
MHEIVELIVNSALLWIFLQTTLSVLVTVLYEFSVPWIVWGLLIILIALKLMRISPPAASAVQEILGINPLHLEKDNSMPENHGNGEQYCMRVVAHRGGGYDYPENSLSAFKNSRGKGCTTVELDVRLTKDNIPIVFHDSTTERLTGQIGTISEMTWEELRNLDISYNHPLRNKFSDGEKIPLLHDALQQCLDNELRVIIDIKETKTDVVQVVLDVYKKYPKLFKRGFVTCFNPIILYMIRKKEPRIMASLGWRPYYFTRTSYAGLESLGSVRFHNPFKHLAVCILETLYEWLLPRFVYYVVGVSVMLLHKDIVNPRVIERWFERNVRVMAWTVNRPSEKIHFSKVLKVTYLTDTLHLEKDM